LGPFFTVNRSFFMSLFFMISGYFMVMSYDRHGPGPFIKSRLLRLGVPLLVFFFLIIPIHHYFTHMVSGDIGAVPFWKYYLDFYFGFGEQPLNWRGPAWPEMNFGHLWYVEHLLIFSLCYALLRLLWKRPAGDNLAEKHPPGYLTILAFALLLAIASAVVRIWYPIDRWVGFLGFIQVAFADVPRDLSFFIIGALAFRRDWFLRFPTRAGYVWLSVGLAAAAFWYAFALTPTFPISRNIIVDLYPVWEALLCCGMCIGLLVLFRELLNFQGRLDKALAQSQYAAYLFHVTVVISLQFAIKDLSLPPLTKFILVTLIGVPLTFLLSYWIRKPQFMKKIL
jgi:peptidoglycan/LPS O-acetylase OafA/YrhL